MHVLLVEPEEALRRELHQFLRRARYTVEPAATYAAAADQLARRRYDFVLLDQGPPDGGGLAFLCEAARRADQLASFIVLTHSDALEDRLSGFASGADDCLPKTVALAELEHRMQAIVRRRFGLKHSEISFGAGFVMDIAVRTLRCGLRAVPLSQRQFDLLYYLLLHRGQALTRQQLNAHLRGPAPAQKRASNYIDVHIKNVRKLLASFAPADFLETVHGIGYRAMA